MNQDRSKYSKPNCDQTKPSTDWLVWFLHFIFGCLPGFGVGFIIASKMARFHFIDFNQTIYVMAGLALCGGAFTSFHGNRAWMMPSIFDVMEPPPTKKSCTCSIIIGIIGGGLVFLPIILNINGGVWPSNPSSSMEFRIISLLIAAIPGSLLVHSLRTGSSFWGFGTVDRDETPLYFWIYVVLNAFALLCILLTLLY